MRPPRAIVASLYAIAVFAFAACAGPAAAPHADHGGPAVCPHDATRAGGVCRCAPGLSVLDGACVGARELDAYCGVSGVAGGAGACPSPRCPSDDAIDLAAGACVSAREARELVAHVRPVPDDLKLGCQEGSSLVVRGDYVTCLPSADLCPRGTDWDAKGARCAAVPACEPGAVRQLGGPDGCVPLVTRERDGVPVVDVGRWAGAVLGVDGGDGTTRLCRPLAQQAAELDVGPGGSRTLELTIELVFPDNDVTQLSARVTGDDVGWAGQKVLDALLVPLRALGGVSDAASTSIRVRCAVRGGETPSFVPR